MLSLIPRTSEIRRRGTPDIEFAVNALLARSLLASGQSEDARRTIETLRARFAAEGQERFLPNMDALLCRIALHTGDLDAADGWYRESAPKDPMHVDIMKQYRYFTQAMVELADGRPDAALLTLAPLETYIKSCARHIDGIHLNVLCAIALFRSRDEAWRLRLSAALDTAAEYRFIRTIADADAAIAPGHGSGDRVLNLNGHSITGGGRIDAGRGGDEGCLTITGGGDVKTEIVVNDGRLTLNAFTGTISTVTIDSGSISSDAGTTGRIDTLNMDSASSRGFLCGGTIGAITANDPNITAADMLAQGYVFRNAEGYVDKTASADGLTEVTVAACDHNGADGFDIDSTACPYCGAPAVVYTQLNLPESAGNSWRKFADLQTALDSDRLGGSVVRRLADVSGDYTIDGTQVTGLDLNGYSINGTVYVKASVSGHDSTSFTNGTSSTDKVTIGKVVAYSGAKIYSSTAIIGTLELADTTSWADILYVPEQYGYRVYTDYPDLTNSQWYAPADVTSTELHNVTIGSLPITSNTLTLKVDGKNYTKPSVERGTTVQLCAYCNTNGASVTFYVGERKGDEYAAGRERSVQHVGLLLCPLRKRPQRTG